MSVEAFLLFGVGKQNMRNVWCNAGIVGCFCFDGRKALEKFMLSAS
jgi:hypothetical protein